MAPWWRFSDSEPAFHLGESYDQLLPVNLLIQSTPPADKTLHLIRPDASTGLLLKRGDHVHLEGFVITEVDQDNKVVTVNRPQPAGGSNSSYRLRLQSVEGIERYRANNIVDSVEGVVTATRHDLLQAQAQEALGADFDLTAGIVTLSNGDVLPNPLAKLSAVLAESPHVKVACVHGDLNLENILVDPVTRDVRLIDFAEARRDHVLHDLLRLETGIVTRLLPETLTEAGLPPETIYSFYEQVHCATAQVDQFTSPALPHPALEKPFAMLVALRQMARTYLFDPAGWAEYYHGLTLYLLGVLKFKNLNALSKQVAFWGAATAQRLAAEPPACPKPRFRWGKRAVVAALIVLVLILGVLAVWSNSPSLFTQGEPLAAVIGVDPLVEVKTRSNNRLRKATFGMILY